MGRPPSHHGHSLPPLPGTPKLFYQVSHPQKSHQHPAVSRTSPATQTSSGSAPPNTRSVSSLAYRARPSPALLPPQPSLLGVVPTGAALQEGARDHSQLQAASQPSGSRICWLLQQSHRYGAELLRPGRARRGQTLSQQQTNSSPSTRPAAGPGGALTHDHDVELEALLHGFPSHLLQDGVYPHVAEVCRRLLRPRRRRLLGAGIPWGVRHAGCVAGNGLGTWGGRERKVRGGKGPSTSWCSSGRSCLPCAKKERGACGISAPSGDLGHLEAGSRHPASSVACNYLESGISLLNTCTLIPALITKTTGAQQKDTALQPGVQGGHPGVPCSRHQGSLSTSLEFLPRG